MWYGGGGGIYPRHLSEGLNFTYMDGHVQFHGFSGTQADGDETFLPFNPRRQ